MLSLPPRFYSNYVVKIEALTILLTSLSLLSHTQAHTHTHTHAHTGTQTHTCLSISGLLSWAALTSCPMSLPVITLRLGNWMELGQSAFLGDFPTAATPQRSLEQKLREVRFRAASIVRLWSTWAAPPEHQARMGRELPDCLQGLVPLPPGLCCLPALPMLWLCDQTPSSFA